MFKKLTLKLQNIPTLYWVGLFLLCVIQYFTIFIHLDKNTIYRWDEGQNAVNSVEMFLNKQYIARYAWGGIDLWETKPPLLIWLNVIGMYVFGVNELSVRWAPASSTFILGIVIFHFFYKRFKSVLISFISALSCTSCLGMIRHHIARTGDHDAILCLFLCLQLLFLISYIIDNKDSNLFYHFAMYGIIFLLKSFAMVFFLVPSLLIILLNKKVLDVLKSKYTYFGLITSFILIVGYLLLREYHSSGCLAKLYSDEIVNRYANGVTGANPEMQYKTFFIEKLVEYHYFPLYMVAIVAIGWLFLKKQLTSIMDEITHRTYFIALQSFIITLVFFLIFISNATIRPWYDAPIYPLLAFIVGFGLLPVVYVFQKNTQSEGLLYFSSVGLVVFLLFNQVQETVLENTKKVFIHPDMMIGFGVNHLIKNKLPHHSLYMMNQYNITQDYFYGKKFEIETNEKFDFINIESAVKDGQITDSTIIKNKMSSTFDKMNDSFYILTKEGFLKDYLILNPQIKLIEDVNGCYILIAKKG